MTTETIMKLFFFACLAVLGFEFCLIYLDLWRAVKKGDVNSVYLGLRSVPLLPRKLRDQLLYKACVNELRAGLERAKERRGNVIGIFSRRSVQVVRTGLEK